MSPREVLVLGSGKRVRQAALPALFSLGESCAVRRVFARTEKTVEAAGRDVRVDAIDALGASDLEGVDLVYAAVAKAAVPEVLARLTALDVSGIDLFKRHAGRALQALPATSTACGVPQRLVSEDCTTLPWFDAVRAAVDAAPARAARRVRPPRPTPTTAWPAPRH